MKYFLLLTLLIAGCCKVEAQYHIRVECIGGTYTDGAPFNYEIKYTFDNWKHVKELPDLYKTADDGKPIYSMAVYSTREEAIGSAKQLCDAFHVRCYVDLIYSTYKYNMKKYNERKLGIDKKQKCCTATQVY